MVAERRAEDSAVTARTGQYAAKVEAELQQIGDDIFEKTMIEFYSRTWSGRFVPREADEATKVASAETVRKTVDVPQVQFLDRVDDGPVVMQCQVLAIQKIQESMETTRVQRIDELTSVCNGADDVHLVISSNETKNDIFSQGFETLQDTSEQLDNSMLTESDKLGLRNVELMEVPETWPGRRLDTWSCRIDRSVTVSKT